MNFGLVIPAFIAGLLTFLAPCTLPLVPGYLAFISGASLGDLRDSIKARAVRRKIFLNGVFFVFGFSLIFILFGTIAGLVGRALVPYRLWLTRIGGLLVILFGLFMLDFLRLPFLVRERQLRIPQLFKRGDPLNSLFLGTAFGLGWTPCVGPILGSILLLASTAATASKGAFLLAVFSLGLAVPFLAIAWGIGAVSLWVEKFGHFLSPLSAIGGLFLIFLGLLLFTNQMSLLISWGYRIFRFINYDKLLNYL